VRVRKTKKYLSKRRKNDNTDISTGVPNRDFFLTLEHLLAIDFREKFWRKTKIASFFTRITCYKYERFADWIRIKWTDIRAWAIAIPFFQQCHKWQFFAIKNEFMGIFYWNIKHLTCLKMMNVTAQIVLIMIKEDLKRVTFFLTSSSYFPNTYWLKCFTSNKSFNAQRLH
jgi:hypothetical protein